MTTRGRTGHASGASRRTRSRNSLDAERATLRAQPPSPARSRRLRQLRTAIANLACRSERAG